VYGINAIEEIKNDPYKLIDIVKGISFKVIDEAALKIGVNTDDEQRITYGIKYALMISTYNRTHMRYKKQFIRFYFITT